MKKEDFFNEDEVVVAENEDDLPFVDAVGDTAEVYEEKEEEVK